MRLHYQSVAVVVLTGLAFAASGCTKPAESSPTVVVTTSPTPAAPRSLVNLVANGPAIPLFPYTPSWKPPKVVTTLVDIRAGKPALAGLPKGLPRNP